MPQADLNAAVWRAGTHTADYDNRVLEPAEVLLLARHRETLGGRVLDVGCGAGRILGYLVALGGEVHGMDISPAMVELCRLRYPDADARVGDLERVREVVTGPFDAIIMSDNILDVFDDARRRQVLSELRSLLAPQGLLIFSSHNLAAWERSPTTAPPARSQLAERLVQLAHRSPSWMVEAVIRLPRRRANRRRLSPLQQRHETYAIVNDAAHDYSLLHYYIARDDQERQLAELGLALMEVLETDGTLVSAGSDGVGPSLYYVARASGDSSQVFPGEAVTGQDVNTRGN